MRAVTVAWFEKQSQAQLLAPMKMEERGLDVVRAGSGLSVD